MAPHHRPETAKHNNSEPDIQNGIRQDDPTSNGSRSMGVFRRFNRCLLSCSCTPSVQEVPKIRNRRESLPVHSSPFWIGNSSENFYHDYAGDSKGVEEPRGQYSPVSRRLAHKEQRSRIPIWSGTGTPTTSRTVRTGSQPEEVRVISKPTLRVCRSPIRPSRGSSVPPDHQGGENTDIDLNVSQQFGSTSRAVVILDRTPRIRHGPSTTRKTACSSTTASPTRVVDSISTTTNASSHFSRHQDPHTLVDPVECPERGSTTSTFLSAGDHIHRCVRSGMGSTLERQGNG